MKHIILSPHIDDGVIGVFSKLHRGIITDIHYFFECTDERKAEAHNVAKQFNVKIHFTKVSDFSEITVSADDILYVPSMRDLHIGHKQINRLAKIVFPDIKKYYYSVDMNNKPTPYSNTLRKVKKIALQKLFLSQSVLLSNEKYHLFEDIREDDSDKMIWVTFQKKGIHKYKQAKHDINLSDVSYLGHSHRHLFKFKVSIEVFHDDREIEFHQFLNWLEGLYDTGILKLNHKSCEMMSDDLYLNIMKKFSNRKLTIEVSEDGECGVFATYQT